MSAQTVCFPPPLNEADVEKYNLYRDVSASFATQVQLVNQGNIKDAYGNWVTYYEDEDATLVDGQAYFYKVEFLSPNDITSTTFSVDQTIAPIKGKLSYQLRVSTVYEQLQGLDAARFQGCSVYRMIGAILAQTERYTRTRLQPVKAVGEIYDYKTFRKILGSEVGFQLKLRHFPIRSIERIAYIVRGSGNNDPQVFTDLDYLIEKNDASNGYNRGVLTIYPRQVTLISLFNGLTVRRGANNASVNVVFDYTHGYTSWPEDLVFHMSNAVAGFAMEIMGEAVTAGISSRSVDGYAESYTASATTTIFSARRGLYMKEYMASLKGYRKGIWSFA